MASERSYDFVKKFDELRNVLVALVLITAVIGVFGLVMMSCYGYKDQLMFIANILSVLVAILMIGVVGYQAKISEHQAEILWKQTKILELDKLPMLVIRKIKPKELAFEIINASKYPIKVEYGDFKPYESYDRETIEEQIRNFRHIFRLGRGILITPGSSLRISGQFEKPIVVPGVLRIKASNVYFPDLVIEYEYVISSGEINKVEGLP
ncbi:hypothetical protein [Archaeoglobus veneficus]|uniref:Uncharacterized protein n=1 Tax=Archaeoglobus veneficus (strain DSM 11195 / SNP6) TaxID=693661 RepID=F2KT69_ARCVS|nr:hypothetical protein [Archaeoglobus veneficus]AEA47099.1 hypothetical protein Arcve_1089 [Archaeoglobus veneficus SNP6]